MSNIVLFRHQFDTCLFEAGAYFTRSTFQDGHVNRLDFSYWMGRGDNSDLAGELGYAGCEALYYWEHDFIHHWIADMKGEGPSEALRHGDDGVLVRQSPLSIRYEEWLVHHIQSWSRTGKPSPHLEALEGWDPEHAMRSLDDGLRSCFGILHDMRPVVKRWAKVCAETNFLYLQDEAYGWDYAVGDDGTRLNHRLRDFTLVNRWFPNNVSEQRNRYMMPDNRQPALSECTLSRYYPSTDDWIPLV